jgi:hypothetical protein
LARLHFEPDAVAALAVEGINEKDKAPITNKATVRFMLLIEASKYWLNKYWRNN